MCSAEQGCTLSLAGAGRLAPASLVVTQHQRHLYTRRRALFLEASDDREKPRWHCPNWALEATRGSDLNCLQLYTAGQSDQEAQPAVAPFFAPGEGTFFHSITAGLPLGYELCVVHTALYMFTEHAR